MATQRKGLISELFARRVPQIVGVYIGACWLAVEMGDWLSEQLGFAPSLVAYLFVLMIALLPSVAVLAWNHGAPGRDRSPRFEKFFVPVNLLFAVVAVIAFFGYAPPGSPGSAIGPAESAVIERTVVDESGQPQTFTVAREGFHRRVFASFWVNPSEDRSNGEIDWRQYAVPWLLAVELNRDPLISISTPYMGSTAREYVNAGYAGAIDEPRALALQQARRIGARYLLQGSIDDGPDGVRLTARVIDVSSGELTDESEAVGADVIAASAELADRLEPILAPPTETGTERYTRIPLAEAATPSLDALEAAIAGLNALHIEQDLVAARAALERAEDIDPTFALASVWLHQVHRTLGDFAAAVQAADRALALEYKLDSQTRFAMKANRHALAGDYDTAMRILGMWTEVHPDSYNAWMTLAQNQIIMGQIEGAAESLRRARELDPDSALVLRQMATVEQLAGDYRAAAERMRAFIAEEPEDVSARLELGRILSRSGQAEAAMEVFETAELLADDPTMARLNRALVLLREGRFDRAEALIESLMAANDGSVHEPDLLKVHYSLLLATGRFRDVLIGLDEHEAMLRQALAPVDFWNSWAEFANRSHLAFGDYAAAATVLDRAEAGLGDPLNRFLALDRIMLLIRTGAPQSEVEAQLDRLKFFEQQFSFGGVLAIVEWGEALAASYAGNTGQAVEVMRAARERFRASGLSLSVDSMESFDLALARILIADDQAAEARRLLDDLLERHPAFADARWERLQLARSTGATNDARSDLDVLLAQWADADEDFLKLQEARALAETL